MDISYSLIIPVHNAEKTLSQTMDSVYKQRKPFSEILLIENGSVDNSLALCQNFAKKYSHIKVIQTKKDGAAHARNIGMQAATSDFFLFLDADDILKHSFLEQIDAEITKDEAKSDLYEYNFFHHFSNGNYTKNPFILSSGVYNGTSYLTNTLKKFHEEAKFMSWRFAYKRMFFLENKHSFVEDILIFEDIVFVQQLCNLPVQIYVMEDMPLLDYLYHKGSLTQMSEEVFCCELIKMYQAIEHKTDIQEQYFVELFTKVLILPYFKEIMKTLYKMNSLQANTRYFKEKQLIKTRKLLRKLGN